MGTAWHCAQSHYGARNLIKGLRALPLFRLILSVLALLAAVACDVPAANESLTDDAMPERLSDQRITFAEPSKARAVWIDLRDDGTGNLHLLQDGRTVDVTPLRWEVADGLLCAAYADDDFDCAATTLSGNAITVAWETSGNRSGVLSGRLSPLDP